jgi:hypothetical protein
MDTYLLTEKIKMLLCFNCEGWRMELGGGLLLEVPNKGIYLSGYTSIMPV